MNEKRKSVTLFWFRRDLRLDDNAGLYHALKNHAGVLPLFIFDTTILGLLPKIDARVQFIHQTVADLKSQLNELGSDLRVEQGVPLDIFKKLNTEFNLEAIYANQDYEPQAQRRDDALQVWAQKNLIQFLLYKDQVIFEKKEIVTDMQRPYTVYTPYKKKWLAALSPFYLKSYPNKKYQQSYLKIKNPSSLITLKQLGFSESDHEIPSSKLSKAVLKNYAEQRDFPGIENATSRLGIHLRFGTVSIRKLVRDCKDLSAVWLSELIWREFFMQIIWNFPHVSEGSFRPDYEKVAWRNDKAEFEKWKLGQTGYPMVDAGLRELNATGFMHNRARMVTASFLTKHLLMHWSKGADYFAEKLLDYDLAANNGNWQWAAGTGCDAAPYFRIFNPTSQLERFDKNLDYIKKWVPEFGTEAYCKPMVEHTFARERALTEFKKALK
ncbi:MAG: deoxyribodipyrimidine photo-lyase [Bdellovibrionaceae bacterium]|nr:deoxyribodipyrimidine photo-lyase [Bdellovibrio sp.]